MYELLKKVLKVLLIIIIIAIALIITHNYYGLKIEGYENIGEPNTAIKSEKLRNISIMASYDTAALNGKINLENIGNVLQTGCRWVDFEVNEIPDKPNYPVISSTLPLKEVLIELKKKNKQSPTSKMPLFINLRINGSHKETFYNIIHKTIQYSEENKDGVFTESDLYQKPGPLKSLLGDVKEKVLGIVDEYTGKIKKDSDEIKKTEGFGSMNTLGTENELYENFTFLDAIYNIKSKPSVEGFEINDDTIDTDIEKTEEEISTIMQEKIEIEKELKKNISVATKATNNVLIYQAREQIQQFKDKKDKLITQLKEKEEILKQLNDRKEKINSDIDKEIDDLKEEQDKEALETENEMNKYEDETKMATEQVAGAGRFAQKTINKLRTDLSSTKLDVAMMKNDMNKLDKTKNDYEKLTKNINQELKELTEKVSDNLSKQVRCERCINGETILKEIEDKIVIIISRNSNTIDGYNNSKLMFNNEDSIVNMEINDYKPNNNSDDNEKVYNMSYDKSEFKNNSTHNSMLVTNITNNVMNFDEAFKTSISNKKIQVVKVSNLANRTSYMDMYSNNNSSFITISDAIKYINK